MTRHQRQESALRRGKEALSGKSSPMKEFKVSLEYAKEKVNKLTGNLFLRA
jgi:hypothetical protein